MKYVRMTNHGGFYHIRSKNVYSSCSSNPEDAHYDYCYLFGSGCWYVGTINHGDILVPFSYAVLRGWLS